MSGLEIEFELETEGAQQALDVDEDIEATGEDQASDDAGLTTHNVPTTRGTARGRSIPGSEYSNFH